MMIIDEKKLNRLWTISKYVYGLLPIANAISLLLVMPSLISNHTIFSAGFIIGTAVIIANTLFGILILSYAPRLGAYLIAALNIINVFSELIVSQFKIVNLSCKIVNLSRNFTLCYFKFGSSDFIVIFAYIVFGLLASLKETARQQ